MQLETEVAGGAVVNDHRNEPLSLLSGGSGRKGKGDMEDSILMG
jgi:hypothetical protein